MTDYHQDLVITSSCIIDSNEQTIQNGDRYTFLLKLHYDGSMNGRDVEVERPVLQFDVDIHQTCPYNMYIIKLSTNTHDFI